MITMEIAKPNDTCVPCVHIYEEVDEHVKPPHCGPYVQRALVCPICYNHKVTEEMRKHNLGQSRAMWGKG